LTLLSDRKSEGPIWIFTTLNNSPSLPPDAYTEKDLLFIVPRVLELVYTAWDIKPFADDVWNESDQKLKEAIRKQWKENRRETGGHSWKLPSWIEAYPEIETDPQRGIPFPPFKWDESRRRNLPRPQRKRTKNLRRIPNKEAGAGGVGKDSEGGV